MKRRSDTEKVIMILVGFFVSLWFVYALWFALSFDF
ncbi:MAG: hypothetical protein QOH36_665 [Actinomycetota bacterium]|nr:hypothetical protein [Actinomycetota bacterium]